MADAEFTGIFRRRIVERIFTTFTPKIGQIQTSVGNGLYKLHKSRKWESLTSWAGKPRAVLHARQLYAALRRTKTEARVPDYHRRGVPVPSTVRLALPIVTGAVISETVTVPSTVGDFSSRNITLKMGQCPAHAYIDPILELIRTGKFDATDIITHVLPLKEGGHGYEIFDRKEDQCIMVVLKPQRELGPLHEYTELNTLRF